MLPTEIAERLSAEWNRLGVGDDQCPYSGLRAEFREATQNEEEKEEDVIVIFDDYESIALSVSSAQELLVKLQSLSELDFEQAWDLLKEFES